MDGDSFEASLDCDDDNYVFKMLIHRWIYTNLMIWLILRILVIKLKWDQVVAAGQLLDELDLDTYTFHFEDDTDLFFDDKDNFGCSTNTVYDC